jgi:hypothetical protein
MYGHVELIHLKEGETETSYTRILHKEGDDREVVASADVLTYVLGVPIERQKTFDSMRLANIMKRAGWERGSGKVTINGKQVRGYFRWVSPSNKGLFG